jgi:hypothetical protein
VTSSRKLADHPHWWTITLSMIAVVVSSLSYWESHRVRVLNEQTNRPLVRVGDIALIGPVLGRIASDESRLPNSYSVNLRNSGKLFASGVVVEYRAQLQDMRVGAGLLKFSDIPMETHDTQSIGDLAPEDEYQLSAWIWVLKDNPTIPFGDHRLNMVSIYIKGVVTYTNPVDGARYKEPFCFSDPGTSGRFRRCSLQEHLE